jgi:hypothetical protein
MFAEAIKAAYPKARSIAVDLATVRLTDPEKHLRFTYLTPRIMQVQLVRYDQGLELAPFDVLLRGAHITRSGTSAERRGVTLTKKSQTKRSLSPAQRRAFEKATQMNKQRLTDHGNVDHVPDRVGGKTPPLQPTADDVPFSRRRAFGLRALQL